jgi:hypothetical protein
LSPEFIKGEYPHVAHIVCTHCAFVKLCGTGGTTGSETSQQNQGGESLAEVGAQLANPVSSVWSIVFQNNFTFLKGEPSEKTRFLYNLNFQPVLPVPLTQNWNLITRPVFPLIFGQPVSDPETGFHGKSGLGDIVMVNLLSPNKPSGFLWGVGPTWIFPTATNDNLGQEKWQVGPAAVGLYLSKDWIFGAFPQQWWSFAGKNDRPDTSQMNIQYFVWRLLPGAWQVGTGAPNITINWKADDDDKVNLPIGLGVAKTVKLGKLPVKLQLEGSYSAVHEDILGQRWNIRFTVTPVIPRLISNAIF